MLVAGVLQGVADPAEVPSHLVQLLQEEEDNCHLVEHMLHVQGTGPGPGTRAWVLVSGPLQWSWNTWTHLDVVQNQLVSGSGRGHLTICDGLPQSLLGDESVQVQDGGQTAVKADELLLVGAEVD